MKILLACEGQSEVELITNLLERGYLHFDAPILLDKPIVLRQLSKIAYAINTLDIKEQIVVYRIGDTLNEKMSLDGFQMRSDYIKQFKVCTKRELEMLIIINEGLIDEYNKCSATVKPKSFIKSHIPGLNLKKYFESHDLINAIKEYKRIKKHKKDEFYLIDLIEGTISKGY